MSLTANVRALHLYEGTIGTYLGSSEATSFDLSNHSWNTILNASKWLRRHNPLFQSLCRQLSLALPLNNLGNHVAVGGLPLANLTNPDQEPPPPIRRPDLIVTPFNFDADVRNEDHRSHRLPAGTIQSSINDLKYIINHGDKHLEMLLFPHLYPHGKGAWVYQGPSLPRYPNRIMYQLTSQISSNYSRTH